MSSRQTGLLWLGCITAALLLGEWIARQGLGLGEPPLYESSPYYEYRLKPNQSVRRFGHFFRTDSLGLRSKPLSAHRTTGQRRLLVLGDSIVWGGSQLNQDLIATELIRHQTGWEVANVAAPSWGPANQLAFLQQHGLLDATDVVLVISSHDASDVPSFKPLTRILDKPTHKPWSALQEAVQRYLLPRVLITHSTKQQGDSPSKVGSFDVATHSLSDLVDMLIRSGARVGAVQFWERDEIRSGRPHAGHAAIAKVLSDHGITPVQAGPFFRGCGSLDDLFTDSIHPYTESGQDCLARVIVKALQ